MINQSLKFTTQNMWNKTEDLTINFRGYTDAKCRNLSQIVGRNFLAR